MKKTCYLSALLVLLQMDLSMAGSSHLRSAGVDVIAHRGASAYAPENTLAAFRLAHELGADWFELDCTLTKDGELIVIHDDTLERTTDGHGMAKDFTLAELKRLDAGTWKDPKFAGESLPTVGEALDFAKGKIGVYIEIKDSGGDRLLMRRILAASGDGPLSEGDRKTMVEWAETSGTDNVRLTRKVIEAVRARSMEGEIVIQSFSPVACLVVLAEAPDMRIEFLAEDRGDEPEAWDLAMRWASLLATPGFNPNRRALKFRREDLTALKARGTTLAVWTVNAKREVLRLADWGVSAIITNRPDDCLRALSENGYR